MPFIRWFRYLGLGLLAVATFANAPSACAQGTPNVPPAITDLKSLSYQKAGAPDFENTPSYQDLETTIRLAHAYARGKRLIPSYHEPFRTRGASGIAVFKLVAPSVVLIVTGEVKNEQFDPSALGAGVILNSSGDILTNWHVINGYRGAVVFLKPEGGVGIEENDAYVARLVSQDEVADLALLRIIKPPSNLHSISVGNIASAQVAEDIHVIGHPEGNLWSYSTGVVSQLRQRYDWTYTDGSKHEANVLQLQTAINPGNSGGPVVNDQGKLLGLVAMVEQGQNLDYAIAADVIQSFLARASSSTMRGGTPEPKSPAAAFSVARLQDGQTVLRAAYPDLTEYLILDENHKALALKVEATDGTDLGATKANSFGGFEEWKISLPGGTSVKGRGSSAVPDTFTAN